MTTHTPPVTVTPVTLTKETYEELLEALAELDCAFGGPTAQTQNARRYIHYRWLVESSEAKDVDVTRKSV